MSMFMTHILPFIFTSSWTHKSRILPFYFPLTIVISPTFSWPRPRSRVTPRVKAARSISLSLPFSAILTVMIIVPVTVSAPAIIVSSRVTAIASIKIPAGFPITIVAFSFPWPEPDHKAPLQKQITDTAQQYKQLQFITQNNLLSSS